MEADAIDPGLEEVKLKMAELEDIENFKKGIAKLQTDVDELQSKNMLLQQEQERWAQEKAIYAKTREWYLNELADRERTVSTLRLQIVQLERDQLLKKAELDNAVDEFSLKNETLIAKAEDLENECKQLREKNMELSNENRNVLESVSAELQVKERLISIHKEEIKSLKTEIESYIFDEEQLRKVLEEKEAALIQINEDNKKISEEARDQVADRELQILQLQEELDKANELLKFVPTSNAFASLAEVLSSGTSLTAIYAQHSKVVAELIEERQKQKHLEEHVQTLLADFKKNAPNVLQICHENDILNAENGELRQQLGHAFGERDKLKSEAGTVARELKFTRTELLAAQRENSTLKKQVQKLLFVLENDGGMVDMNVSQDDVAVFSNIRELHEQNIALINQLEEMKRSIEENLMEKQEEIGNLQQKISEASHEIDMLRDSQEKAALTIEELEKERDVFKEELEKQQQEPSPHQSFRSSRNFTEPEAANNAWKTKCEMLEEKLQYIVGDRHKNEEALNNRVDSQMELISQLRLTNGRLESDLEYQKKNQGAAFKKVNELEKEISKKNEQIAKFKAQMESDAQKINQLNYELNVKLDEISKLNVNYQLLNEKYDVARNNAISFEAQYKALREYSSGEKRNELEEEISQKDEQIAQLKVQMEDAAQKINQLSDELNLKLEEMAELNASYQLLSEQYDAAAASVVSYENQVKALQESQFAADEKVNELEKEISKKNDQIEKFQAQIEGDSQKINKLTNEVHHYLDDISKLNANYQLLSEQHDTAKANAVSLEGQLKALRESRFSGEKTNLASAAFKNPFQQITQVLKQNEMSNLKTGVFKQNEFSRYKTEIASLNQKNQTLTQEYEEARKQLEEAKKKINESRELEMRVKSLSTLFETMKSKTAQQDLELNKLRTERDNAIKAMNDAAAAVTTSSQSRKRTLQEDSVEVILEMSSEAHVKKSRVEPEGGLEKEQDVQQDMEMDELKIENDNAVKSMDDASAAVSGTATLSESLEQSLQEESASAIFGMPSETQLQKLQAELNEYESNLEDVEESSKKTQDELEEHQDNSGEDEDSFEEDEDGSEKNQNESDMNEDDLTLDDYGYSD